MSSHSAPLARWQWPDVSLALGIALAGIGLCVPGMWNVTRYWEYSEFYGHAFLMPIVAGWFVYENRRAITAALRVPRPPVLGFLAVFVAAAFEVLMFVGDVGSAAGVGVPLVAGAVAYAIGGRSLLEPLLIPLLFVALMVPPPGFLLTPLLVSLKLIVTDTAVSLLQAAGTTVGAEGNLIQLPGQTLFVADVCSGLTSIITLLPIAGLIAFGMTRGAWRRILVLASAVPFAMAANVTRVIVTVMLVTAFGPEVAQGAFHQVFGVATYAGCTLAVVGLGRLLR